jgi:AraC family transcriptional regulator of adaptative response / DNA-3-methyladenine glycosylase II
VSSHPLTLDVPAPFHGEALLVFFGRHAVAGIETLQDHTDAQGRRLSYRRTLLLPGGPAVLHLTWAAGGLSAELESADAEDLEVARQRVTQLCDLGTDPEPIRAHLSRDEQLRPLLAASPGLRVPGVLDPHEHLLRTMIGQQISLAGAANLTAKLVVRFGALFEAGDGLSHLFPTAAALATADPATLPMPRARGRALVEVATALADGTLVLTSASDPAETRSRLLRCRGVGPWTADYVLMRALHDPDILLASDLVIRRELVTRGLVDTAGWSPWRSYATMHLWRAYTG